jgi:ectoine hydroxylase-related dioxygenase (phytanoyl-CoA dioxygenase family)
LHACGIDALAASFLGTGAFPVDATYFDKQSTANWAVPVHQDRILPVHPDTKRPLRRAKGVAVSEPSPSTLAQLLALRIHFDPTDGDTGALFVLPGSHRAGVLTPDQIKELPLQSFVPCVAAVGDVILMRPLLLHRSPPSKGPGQRRVLHVVYAAREPDDGLRWASPSLP